ncbi:MAG TPA: T9SS type A sorting domain-containing protein [bacterium]|nr:T9SS type A sorting domain-containing protein [bacterium]
MVKHLFIGFWAVFLGVLPVTGILAEQTLSGRFTSKWDRVMDLAQEVTVGNELHRMMIKDSIMSILYAQEPGYPIVYVDADASGANNGSSWKDAFTSLQAAINHVHPSEAWIWVAAGRYTGNYYEDDYGKYQSVAAIKLKSGVMVFGGFAGHETRLYEQDPERNVTIIQNRNGPNPQGPRAVDMDHKTLIDGFLIRNSGYRGYHSVLSDWIAGGGIRTRDWFTIIRNNRVTGNHTKDGAGIAVWNRHGREEETIPGYSPIIENNFIYDNHAVCGAVQFRNSEVLFIHNVVAYNYHDVDPGDMDRSKGVEIVLDLSLSDKPYIINSILWRNTGGGIFPDLYNHVNNAPDAKALSYYNCVGVGGYGPGLVQQDPMFQDESAHDYSLKEASPCIDAGHPDGPLDPDSTRADIGVFTLRYRLEIIDGGVGAKTHGRGRYFPGTRITISVDSVVLDSYGTSRLTFLGWEGTGEGSYTGPQRTPTVVMNEPITQTVIWNQEYYLDIQTGTQADALSGWFSEGTIRTIEVPRFVYLSDDTRRRFVRWQGEGTGSYSGGDTVIAVTLNNPVRQVAEWQNEYYLAVVSEYGGVTGSGWYAEGSNARFSVQSQVAGGSGVRHVFTHWEGSEGGYTGSDLEPVLVMNGPVVQTAHWNTQYELTIHSDYGSPQGAGWYDAMSQATISVTTPVLIAEDTQMALTNWHGNAYSGTEPSFTFEMAGPVTQTAVWHAEYWLNLSVSPQWGGNISPVSVPGSWEPSGKQITLYAFGNTDSLYTFHYWSGDVSSSVDSTKIIVQQPMDITAHFRKANIVIETEPPGLRFLADGILRTGPHAFYRSEGTGILLDVPDPQLVEATTRYTFRTWNNTSSRQQTVTASSQTMYYVAYFDTAYFLRIENDFGTGQGEGWYLPGETASLSVDSLLQITADIRKRFSEWEGTGPGAVQSTQRQISVQVQGPVVQSVQWVEQYTLETRCTPESGGSITLTPAGPWHDRETEITLNAIPQGSGVIFTGWTGDLNSSVNPLIVTIQTPLFVQANFNATSNVAPTLSGLPDITIFEDQPYVFPNISQYVSDQNDGLENLTFSVNEECHFSVDYDPSNTRLILIPEQDWNGSEDVILTVRDPWMLSDSDTFHVTVLPVPDPPGVFSLLWPSDGASLPDTSDHITFIWERSENVDDDSPITYEFNLGPDSSFTTVDLRVSTGVDTFLILNKDQISGSSFWGVRATNNVNKSRWCNKKFLISMDTSVDPVKGPESFHLHQNYPNPFNAGTRIFFELNRPDRVEIFIYDGRGRRVQEFFVQGGPGTQSVHWDATDLKGRPVPSGIYIAQIRCGSESGRRIKMLLIR